MPKTGNRATSRVLALSAMSVLTLSACNTVNVAPADYWWSSRVADNNSSIDIRDIRRSTTPSNEILLAITLKNSSSITKSIAKYKVEWFTADGMLVNSILSRWNTVSLLQNEQHTVQAVSPSSQATEFFVTLTSIDSNAGNSPMGEQ